MAEEKKKAAQAAEVTEPTEATEPTEVTEPVDDGREDIFIPRGPKNDDPNLFVSVNGKNYLLPRGQKSRVPHEVAAEIHRAWEAEEIRTRNEEKLANGEPLTGE